MRENNVIKKANTLINAPCRLNIYEQKILYKVISQIHIKDKDFKDYEVKISELVKFLGANSNTIYEDIKMYTHNLLEHVLVIEKERETIQTNWFSAVRYVDKRKILFSFHPALKPYLLNLKESFTRFAIENVQYFKCKHSPKIYELLKQYEKLEYRLISIKELRKKLVLECSYKSYNALKKYVLLVVREEINKRADITFDFAEVKEGRKVVQIIFYIKSKNVQKSKYIDLPLKNNIIDTSNNKVIGLKNKINKVIDDEVDNRKILEWLEAEKENDIYFYLDNWNKWDYKEKKTKAGFFIDLVDNNRSIPLGEKGIRVSKPIQSTNYDQRQYDDEFFNSLYDNVKFTRDED